MQPYKIEFFDRQLDYVFHDSTVDLAIDNDYLSITTNAVEIASNDRVKAGHFIKISREDGSINFFGVVSDVSPKEHVMSIRYRPFVSLFDEDVLFDTTLQGTSGTRPDTSTLENVLKKYITDYYVSNSDSLQNLPIVIYTSALANHTRNWSMNIKSDTQGANKAIVGLYKVLIINALKQYGIAINVTPNFTQKRIELTIYRLSEVFKIDGDLKNVNVKTLKVNDRPDGVNKLTVYNADDYSLPPLNFYVHTDRTWDVDGTTNRIVPVVRDVKAATPDSQIAEEIDYDTAFVYAALDVAYNELSGLTWDNLIELECLPDDKIVRPLEMRFGQTIELHYAGATYESILTGISIDSKLITLTFGSERIRFTKNRQKNRT